MSGRHRSRLLCAMAWRTIGHRVQRLAGSLRDTAASGFATTLVTACLPLIAACQGYDFTVNERVVYSPPPLFSDFDIDDPALRECVAQSIADQSVTTAQGLESLNCSHAGITRLDGLAVFTGLRRLRLSANRVRNLVELGSMAQLEELYLDGNRVVDPVPLYRLARLHTVDLTGNDKLNCPRPGGFPEVVRVVLPRHCP